LSLDCINAIGLYFLITKKVAESTSKEEKKRGLSGCILSLTNEEEKNHTLCRYMDIMNYKNNMSTDRENGRRTKGQEWLIN
jgi:hypothetical protein